MPLRNSASTAPRDFLFVVPIAWRNMNSAVRRVKQVPPSSLMHTIAAKVCFLWRFGEVPRMEQTRSFSLYRLVKIRERRANGVQTTLLPAAGRISAVKFRDERLKATSSRLHSEGRRPRPAPFLPVSNDLRGRKPWTDNVRSNALKVTACESSSPSL